MEIIVRGSRRIRAQALFWMCFGLVQGLMVGWLFTVWDLDVVVGLLAFLAGVAGLYFWDRGGLWRFPEQQGEPTPEKDASPIKF